jgi:hypothetical protein
MISALYSPLMVSANALSSLSPVLLSGLSLLALPSLMRWCHRQTRLRPSA